MHCVMIVQKENEWMVGWVDGGMCKDNLWQRVCGIIISSCRMGSDMC